jgi:hypothetical protein
VAWGTLSGQNAGPKYPKCSPPITVSRWKEFADKTAPHLCPRTKGWLGEPRTARSVPTNVTGTSWQLALGGSRPPWTRLRSVGVEGWSYRAPWGESWAGHCHEEVHPPASGHHRSARRTVDRRLACSQGTGDKGQVEAFLAAQAWNCLDGASKDQAREIHLEEVG